MTDLPAHLIAAAILLRDDAGRVLMVGTAYHDTLVLPGGLVEPGESPAAAAEREVMEETGLIVAATRLLVVQHIGARPGLDPVLQLVFDAAPIPAGTPLVPQEGEVTELRWLAPSAAAASSNSWGARRLLAALEASSTGTIGTGTMGTGTIGTGSIGTGSIGTERTRYLDDVRSW